MKSWMMSLMLVMTAAGSGCATSFTGSAHVEEGRAGCERKCAGQGLAMSGMVYMGEYSSACVCEVPGASGSSGSSAGAAAGGATGVVMQMRAAQEQQRQQAQLH